MAGPSLPARQARDNAKAEDAAIRHRTAWQRVAWAVGGLSALLVLRDELREYQRDLQRDLRNAGGLVQSSPELLAQLALRHAASGSADCIPVAGQGAPRSTRRGGRRGARAIQADTKRSTARSESGSMNSHAPWGSPPLATSSSGERVNLIDASPTYATI